VSSTRTVHDRVTRLPASSRARSVRRYGPSWTTAPALLRPFQVTVALPPAPARVAIAAPIVEPDTGAAVKFQFVAPVAPSFTVTLSRIPSPFGEIRELLADEDTTTGGTVSIVTPKVARAPVTKTGLGSK